MKRKFLPIFNAKAVLFSFLALTLTTGISFTALADTVEVKTTSPDNTGINQRDRDGRTLTPEDQSEKESDRLLTQKIRQALVADDSLSVSAKNVKIITIDGVVTLMGPVQSEEEKRKIAQKAQDSAGQIKVHNQLEVMNPSS